MPLPVSSHPCLQDEALSTIFELNTYITGEINLKNISADEKYHQFAGRCAINMHMYMYVYEPD